MAVQNPIPPYKNPSAVASGFGRFFYAVESTVYFSSVLEAPRNVGICYQKNDPTSDDISDLLNTDGGVIPLDGAVNIRALQAFRTGILVFADNGVWYIYNPDGGFTATAYNTSKITEAGIDSPRSVVPAEGNVYYFSSNGIMQIVANEFDNLTAQDITQTTIRKYYLDNHQGVSTTSFYKREEKQVWWISGRKMLVLDLRTGGFYPQENASTTRTVVSGINEDNTTLYLNFVGGSTLNYNFAELSDELFKDFDVDQEAYLVTGFETLGKFSHKKSITEADFFFNKTESQIVDFVDNEYVYDKPSSCLFQARWDYDNSNAYKKWVGRTTSDSGSGKKMELYKPMRRGFIPDSFPWTFDTGESLIRKKVRIRGNGDAVQFRFEAQDEKDLQLLGYSVMYSVKGRM